MITPSRFKNLAIVLALICSMFSFTSTPAQALVTCVSGGPCSIGDTGPGGGVIFYVAPTLFDCGPTFSDRCKYLEYAALDGVNPWVKSDIPWSGTSNALIGTTSAVIGSGYKNTLSMIAQSNTANRAGTAAQAYRGPNNLNDWYLPSIDELEALRIYDVNHTNELNQDGISEYWSSTEVDYRDALFLNFLLGSNDPALKSGNIAIHPIRAFGSTNFINCGTSGTFSIESNIVTGNSSCVGSVEIPRGVTSIGNEAFSNNSQITSVIVPNTVQTIGLETFKNTTSMTTITFEDGSVLDSINGGAFEGSAISSIRIPDSVSNLGLFLFYRATSLTSVTLPAEITYIGESMFESASSLTTVIFPNSVTTIEGSIFKNATSLSSFTIPSGVTSLDLNAFENTPALTSYTYCGTELSDASLTAAGLGSKTRNSCVSPIVYTPPPPVPFLKSLTPPKITVINNQLFCTAGTYRAGYTIDGVIQGNPDIIFAPSQYTFTLLINGISQLVSQITISNPTTSWPLITHPSDILITCSVAVTFNFITNVDKSTDNTEGLSIAEAKRTQKLQQIQSIYQTALNENSNSYSRALVDNRAQWRNEIENIRTNYYETLARIAATTQTSSTNKTKLVSDRSTALKIMIAAQKKSAADYAASKPAALLAKENANKVALTTRDAAAAAVNADYGSFIQSIGYGVLVP